jgi:lipocalin
MHFVQPVPEWWNVVIIDMRHEEQVFASTSKYRLDANNKDVGDVKLVVVSSKIP